jgi:nicotinic acid mononucleotide adenylyltransferase
MVIVPRRGYPTDGLRLQIDLPLLSSTEIRDLIAEGRDVSGMVDYEVLRFVEARALYHR